MGYTLALSKAAWMPAGRCTKEPMLHLRRIAPPRGPGCVCIWFARAVRRPRTVAPTCSQSCGRCRTCGPALLGRNGLRPDCGGPNVHGPWCSLRESHVRRERRYAFQSGWSGGVDARRGLAAGGPAQHSSGRSNTTAIHLPPTCGVVAYRILNLGS